MKGKESLGQAGDRNLGQVLHQTLGESTNDSKILKGVKAPTPKIIQLQLAAPMRENSQLAKMATATEVQVAVVTM